MKKSNIKKIDVTTIKLNPNNPRIELDVPSMVEEIRHAGRVHEPLHVNEDTMTVLRGNRRLSAIFLLLKDQFLPNDLKAAIEKVDCIMYKDLTRREETEIVFDHGSQKGLTRVEIVLAVWALAKQMYSERNIITLMFHMLGKYTQNTQKAHEAQNIPAGEQREKFLKDWLHGTVGNFLMPAAGMGPIVREQLLLTDTLAERALTDEEKSRVKFKVSRTVIADLNRAKNKDVESSGWSPDEGGVNFNAAIEKLIKETKDGKPSVSRKPTTKEMELAADAMQSNGLRLAYKHCSGSITDEQKATLDQVDTEIARKERLQRIALQNVDRVDLTKTFSGEEVRELLRFFVVGGEVQFTEYVQRFLSAPAV